MMCQPVFEPNSVNPGWFGVFHSRMHFEPVAADDAGVVEQAPASLSLAKPLLSYYTKVVGGTRTICFQVWSSNQPAWLISGSASKTIRYLLVRGNHARIVISCER